MPNTTGEAAAFRPTPETWRRAHDHPDAERPFPEVLRERMDAAGIETHEELWERFAEVGGEKLQRWRFLKNCRGENMHIDFRFLRGVVRVFGYDFDTEEAAALGLAYINNWRHKDLDLSDVPRDGRGKA
jgi:hypothetical protein